MPQVNNWQLGREMGYVYDAKYPARQFAFVFNINRCIACQTCTMACKSTWTFSKGQEHMWWANVETKPYGGYPQSWDAKILRMLEEANPGEQRWSEQASADGGQPYGQYEGQTIYEAAERALTPDSARVLGYLPTDEEWNSPNIYEDNPVGGRGVRNQLHTTGEQLPTHNTWFFYLARICNHCSYPACLAACPRKAIYKRSEDGIVLIDQEQCRGYRKCVEACPYKKAMYRGNTRTSEKCIACYPRVEGTDPESDGQPMETRCMASCIGQIRMQGLVQLNDDGSWAEDRQNPLYYLVHVAKVALPLYPQLGTQPNGYYIPPRWVPRPYLRQMFGPGVDEAIERYANPDRELLAVLQLFRRSNKIIFRYEFEEGPQVYEGTLRGRPVTLYNDTVIAFGNDGNELFRTTVEEPIHVRPEQHANSI
ncbi:MAG: dehydrogenase [Vicinamibacterales bacterium]|jgi:nitrate reductase beta subunit|nr:nitrate oxidoreductase subunit beta [Acidobacteriota bacterium]MDP7478787.1 dehydrogenase [Vicinamibacterales bacterium]MDP7670370.1 dehydrogenase [Vicinamibacterales bacterium]HJO38027.1 4Fe-4S dicluster domain-containing protein [Vicinamibacterales bacterium]